MVSLIRDVRRKYLRFRSDARYDSPLLIFFCDVGISISKLMFLALLVLIAWMVFLRLSG